MKVGNRHPHRHMLVHSPQKPFLEKSKRGFYFKRKGVVEWLKVKTAAQM